MLLCEKKSTLFFFKLDNVELRWVDPCAVLVCKTELKVTRVTHEPGWRWSECVKPAVGTDSCQVGHLIHVTSGRIVVRMDDGSEAEFGPGDVGSIPPGHDAWVVGDEPFISIDFGDALYAKQQS